MAQSKPSMLILSFSPIAADARVLKQVNAFRTDYRVTTCGYGPAPEGVERHLEIPESALNRPFGPYLRVRAYRAAFWLMGSVRAAMRLLRGMEFDVALANDVEAVPVALGQNPRYGVHADLHEYSPLLHDENPAWRSLQTPYLEWLCRTYVTRARSWSTVSNGLAREYMRNFGFDPQLVTNAAPYVEAQPTAARVPLRLVHSGAGMRDRFLDTLFESVLQATNDVTLDLYLTRNQPDYVDELAERAAATHGRITVHAPVPYQELAATLRQYDVGVHLLPPVNFNNRWALPNKLFDYVQARLGVVIGPSPEMAHYVERYGLGIVAPGFEPKDLTAALDALTADEVTRWKTSATVHARELSAETQVTIWRRAIAALVGAPPAVSEER